MSFNLISRFLFVAFFFNIRTDVFFLLTRDRVRSRALVVPVLIALQSLLDLFTFRFFLRLSEFLFFRSELLFRFDFFHLFRARFPGNSRFKFFVDVKTGIIIFFNFFFFFFFFFFFSFWSFIVCFFRFTTAIVHDDIICL